MTSEKDNLEKQLKELIDSLKSPPGIPTGTYVRPRGWNQATVASYYKECFAIELKVILDTVLEENKDFLFRCAIQKPPMTKRALEAKVSQAFHYILDHLDTPDKKYSKLRKRLEVSMRHPDGILLRWKRLSDPKTPTDSMAGEAIDSIEYGWREKIMNFIENADEGQKLEIRNAGLSEEDFNWINTILQDVSDVIMSPKSDTSYIKLIKSSILKEL